ncbi:MAG: hypothetical protein ACK4GL_08985 [Flavobacteriales bacterium]
MQGNPAHTDFPLFRKTNNGKSFYKITAKDQLIELQIIGTSFLLHHLKAELYPEKLFIHELIDNSEQRYLVIDETEFESMLRHCREHLKSIA